MSGKCTVNRYIVRCRRSVPALESVYADNGRVMGRISRSSGGRFADKVHALFIRTATVYGRSKRFRYDERLAGFVLLEWIGRGDFIG